MEQEKVHISYMKNANDPIEKHEKILFKRQFFRPIRRFFNQFKLCQDRCSPIEKIFSLVALFPRSTLYIQQTRQISSQSNRRKSTRFHCETAYHAVKSAGEVGDYSVSPFEQTISIFGREQSLLRFSALPRPREVL